MTLRQKITAIRAWIRRNEHKPWNADDLVARIKRNWPTTSEADVETIYQQCWTERDR